MRKITEGEDWGETRTKVDWSGCEGMNCQVYICKISAMTINDANLASRCDPWPCCSAGPTDS